MHLLGYYMNLYLHIWPTDGGIDTKIKTGAVKNQKK